MANRKECRSLCEYQVRNSLSTITIKLYEFSAEAEDVFGFIYEIIQMTPEEAKEYINKAGFRCDRVEITSEPTKNLNPDLKKS